MSTVHGNPRLQCDICLRQFKEARKLKSHLTTHSGDRPFKCNQCPKGFTYRYGLLRHMGKDQAKSY